MTCRGLLVSLAWVTVLAPSVGAAPGTPEDARASPTRTTRSTRGSELRFFGWSRDSRLIAYTRQRIGRARPDQRMHRFVEDGVFAGFGKMVGGDVETYARERRYIATALRSERTSESRWDFALDGETLVLTIEVGRGQSWRLTRGAVVLAEHGFDRIYVDLDVAVYPSPDRTQAVVVMHLDTGWEVDAAIFPISLTHPTAAEK